MKKLLIVGQFENSANNFDGPGIRVCGVKKAYGELGFDVHLIGSSIEDSDALLFRRSFSSFFLLDQRSKYIKDYIISNRFDVVHTFGNFNGWFTGHLFLYFYKLRFGKLIAIDIVDMLVTIQANIISRSFKTIDEYLVKNIFARFLYDKVLVISSKLEEFYKVRNVDSFILPTISCNEMIGHDRKVGKKDTAGINLLYVGYPFSDNSTDVSQFKDRIDLMVRAVSSTELVNIKLKIVGITAQQYLNKVPDHEDLVKNVNIEFVGNCSRDRVQKHYMEADYFLLVRDKTESNDFGFPTKVVEALSHGVKIITTRTSDLDKYLTDTECIFVGHHAEDIINRLSDIEKNYDKFEVPLCFQSRYYTTSLAEYINK